MSCESTDNEIKLAKEYKSLLSHIRPLIQQLDKSKGMLSIKTLKMFGVYLKYYYN